MDNITRYYRLNATGVTERLERSTRKNDETILKLDISLHAWGFGVLEIGRAHV